MDHSAYDEDNQALSGEAIRELMEEVPGWKLVRDEDAAKLRRTFKFKNFAQALDFTTQVGELAEEEHHHPTITLTWGRSTVTWYTHDVNGLHRKDFTMAARTDELYTAA